jgi:hypothetical protein
MIDVILDLLPDETGEVIGCALMGGITYLYIDHLEAQNKNEKSKAQEIKAKMEDLSRKFNASCLSPEAINYLKNEKKG